MQKDKKFKERDEFRAIILNCFFPGAGQIYIGQIEKSIIYISAFLVLKALEIFYFKSVLHKVSSINFYSFLLTNIGLSLFEWILIVSACIGSWKYVIAFRGRSKKRMKIFEMSIGVFLLVFVMYLRVFLENKVLQTLDLYPLDYVKTLAVPTDIMAPTIISGDKVLIDKKFYLNNRPKRGDVIAFYPPHKKNFIYLERIVGLPGENIKIKDRDVFIDNKLVISPQVIKDIVYYNDGKYGKEGQNVNIPENKYFVLGDLNKHSNDSRFWGFLPKENILGKVYFIYYPLERKGEVK